MKIIKKIEMTEAEFNAIINKVRNEAYKRGIIDAGNQYKKIVEEERNRAYKKSIKMILNSY